MSCIANLIWIVFGGIWTALLWLLLGILLCITVIGMPLGLQCFKAAKLTFAPFGKRVVTKLFSHPIANVVWAVLVGWEFALLYFAAGLICCVTVIGIPVGLQSFKIAKLALFPFGAKII